MSKKCKPTKSSDRDSDYGSSEDDTGEPTTFRMLIDKMRVSDIEFIDCCQEIGLVASKTFCPKCSKLMDFCESERSLDGVEWRCSKCKIYRTVREGSWLEDIRQVTLPDLICTLDWWGGADLLHLIILFISAFMSWFTENSILALYFKAQLIPKSSSEREKFGENH